jgi:hypothetical protein
LLLRIIGERNGDIRRLGNVRLSSKSGHPFHDKLRHLGPTQFRLLILISRAASRLVAATPVVTPLLTPFLPIFAPFLTIVPPVFTPILTFFAAIFTPFHSGRLGLRI